jgi:hypothetical protein
MLDRALNKTGDHPAYALIDVCDRWHPAKGGSFNNFLADLGERPTGMTLDRIDNNAGYSPSNCRWATPNQQQHNQGLGKGNTSGFKGVRFHAGKWSATIGVDSKSKYLGRFGSPELAALAYDTAAVELHGEFAVTNASLGLLKKPAQSVVVGEAMRVSVANLTRKDGPLECTVA